MKEMSKAAKKRLMGSKFFHEVEELLKAFSYYQAEGDTQTAEEMWHKWEIARLALEYITGNSYEFTQYEKYFAVVNYHNREDKLIIVKTAERRGA